MESPATIFSATLLGTDACIVSVEVDVARGLPSFATVGLAEGAIKEGRDRIRAAIRNSGYDFPPHRITVNLAPADIRKLGTSFDLPIAVGILAASGRIPHERCSSYLLFGELSLEGRIRSVRGVLPVVAAARQAGFRGVVVPRLNMAEAAVVDGIEVRAAECLGDVVEFLLGTKELASPGNGNGVDPYSSQSPITDSLDLADVKGQELAKRALEIAAAGSHALLMIGPPGSGKTMLARRLPGLLPPMSFEEAIEVTKIHSVAGTLPAGTSLVVSRPFRAPHHTISNVALAGGGHPLRPGEITLAHNGVLFLDELLEFRRSALEVLRQPLEEGFVSISRAQMTATFPARSLLVCALNPCLCGFLGDGIRVCTCTSFAVERYRSRISGPLLDRIDIQIEVPAVKWRDLSSAGEGERTAIVATRVANARDRQNRRFTDSTSRTNSDMTPREVREHCRLDSGGVSLLGAAVEKLGLSARAHSRILKVARTIADLEDADRIQARHVAEAIQYRILDRGRAGWADGRVVEETKSRREAGEMVGRR